MFERVEYWCLQCWQLIDTDTSLWASRKRWSLAVFPLINYSPHFSTTTFINISSASHTLIMTMHKNVMCNLWTFQTSLAAQNQIFHGFFQSFTSFKIKAMPPAAIAAIMSQSTLIKIAKPIVAALIPAQVLASFALLTTKEIISVIIYPIFFRVFAKLARLFVFALNFDFGFKTKFANWLVVKSLPWWFRL